MRHPELILDARIGPADWLSLRGWQRLLLTSLIVCLPVPVLAASGLAVPLPAIVYRVAMGLAERTQEVAVGVPGFDAVVTETTEAPRRGTIKLSAQELAGDRSASIIAAHEHVGDGVRAGRERRRHAALAVVREAASIRPRPHPARDASDAGGAATAERQDPTPRAAFGGDVALPPALPSSDQSVERQEDGPRPEPTPTAAEQDRPSPRPADEPNATPSESPPPREHANSDTRKGAPTSEPPAVRSDAPKPHSSPASSTDQVAMPDPSTPREAPRVQVDTPNTGSPAVTPPVQVDTPKPGSLPVTPPVPVDAPDTGSVPATPPVKSNDAVSVPQLPGELELPGGPGVPRLPGRAK